MDGVMVDTDVFSYLMKGGERAEPYRRHVEGKRIAISYVTVGELYAGATKDKWGPTQRAKLETRLKAVVIIPYDIEICRQYALMANLRTPQGSHRIIPANDRWIAACAMRHGLTLITNNRRDFDDIPNLTIISETPRPAVERPGILPLGDDSATRH